MASRHVSRDSAPPAAVLGSSGPLWTGFGTTGAPVRYGDRNTAPDRRSPILGGRNRSRRHLVASGRTAAAARARLLERIRERVAVPKARRVGAWTRAPRRVRCMSERFYSDARLYDRLFPGGEPAVDFYRAEADRQGGRVLELGCGTGHKLIPIASDGHPCTGLELSSDMLTEAQRKADERAIAVEWVQGDMRDFDLGRTFDLVFVAANSLLHLHEAADLLRCFRSVRAHLAPGARFIFDVFNPNVRVLADADGVRRTRDALSFVDPDRGDVRVDVAETYDAAAQVTRGTWHFSADSEPDFLVAPLELRSIFPQELPLLLSLAGLRLVERFGDWSGRPFTGDAAIQLCVCESD
ncbi:class I SAM-dependent methyltransferase [Nocardioides iriomotensis]|uniref:Class I SAM-dependent methyltransferase n=2 Tax=Nocardioides iriomotensis TaxID=715784 RepID=A0A4Q5J5M7_9ACTN|nr:class I SAM-dependent methyltransferase [Nocardioides iriomotensis]